MEAEELFIDEIAAIIARLMMQAEQLSLHIAGLKQHSDNDEVASEEARLQKMQRHLHRLQKKRSTTRAASQIPFICACPEILATPAHAVVAATDRLPSKPHRAPRL